MGGLLIADAARDIAKNTRAGDKLWPHIVALIGASACNVADRPLLMTLQPLTLHTLVCILCVNVSIPAMIG